MAYENLIQNARRGTNIDSNRAYQIKLWREKFPNQPLPPQLMDNPPQALRPDFRNDYYGPLDSFQNKASGDRSLGLLEEPPFETQSYLNEQARKRSIADWEAIDPDIEYNVGASPPIDFNDPATQEIMASVNPVADQMRRDGPVAPGFDYTQLPEGGIGGGSISGLSPWQGYSIPGAEVTPAQQRAMNEQITPGFQQYFGGGHPDEISLAQAQQHYGYGQFTRNPPGLLESGGEILNQSGPLTETSSEGGKWEDNPIFGEYMMKLGKQISGGPSKWR